MINQSKQITIQAGLIFLTMLTEFSPPSSRSGNTNVLLNLTKHQQTNLYLYIKDPFESKDQLLINGRQKIEIKYEKKS